MTQNLIYLIIELSSDTHACTPTVWT